MLRNDAGVTLIRRQAEYTASSEDKTVSLKRLKREREEKQSFTQMVDQGPIHHLLLIMKVLWSLYTSHQRQRYQERGMLRST